MKTWNSCRRFDHDEKLDSVVWRSLMVFRESIGEDISLTYENNKSLRDPRNTINEQLQTALRSVRHGRTVCMNSIFSQIFKTKINILVVLESYI